MYHSIYFGEKNTWDDWKLIPSSRPVFVPAPVKTSYVNIPGGNGTLDLTETLTGRPTYSDREGSFEFVVTNSYDPGFWAMRYAEIANYLHGKRMRAVLEDDPAYFYEGRFSVNQWKSGANYSTITIDYHVGPFKYDMLEQKKTLSVKGSGQIALNGGQAPIAPTIVASAAMQVAFGGKSHALEAGENYIPELVLAPGKNTLAFTGSGSVTVSYRGGSL